MAKRGISIRITFDRLEALYNVCRDMLTGFEPVNEHQTLLCENMQEFSSKLRNMMARNQGIYTLHLVGAEYVAFAQLWSITDVKKERYARIVVDLVMNKINNAA